MLWPLPLPSSLSLPKLQEIVETYNHRMEIFSFSATAEGHWKLIRMHSSRVLMPIKFHPLSSLSFKVELMCLSWLLGILHWNGGWALCQFPKRFPWLPQLFFGLLLEPLNLFHLKFFSALCLRLGRLGFGLTFPVTQQSVCLHMHTNTHLFQTPWDSPKCPDYRDVPVFGTIKGDLNTEASSFQELILHWKRVYQTRRYPYFRAWNRRVPLYLTNLLVCWVYQWKHHTAQQPMGNLGTRLSNGHTVAIYMTHTGM